MNIIRRVAKFSSCKLDLSLDISISNKYKKFILTFTTINIFGRMLSAYSIKYCHPNR